MLYVRVCLLCLFVGASCGSVSTSELRTDGGDAAAAGEMACLPYNTQGFALHVDQACGGDAGRCLPSDPRCCYAHCELNGAQFIGCADNAAGAAPSRCYVSCSDCPP